ncbi:MAG: ferredoxin family protein [Planctomycetes bacterium]|nr:ferredoxin family protein [Planctomycetota bacterium]
MNQPSVIVVSRCADTCDPCRQFEDRTVECLAAKVECPIVVVPHLYNLTADHPAARRLAALKGQVTLGSWLHERPARWTLAALGCDPQVFTRMVRSQEGQSPEAYAEALAGDATPAGDRAAGRPAVETFDEPVSTRWYPVVDYSCCVGCRQCLDFCLFGVYELDEGDRVVAANPDNCKPGCPACSRVCPAGAIMFPHYEADPVIAGREPAAGKPDAAAEQARAAEITALRDLAAAEAERSVCSRESADGPDREGSAPPRSGDDRPRDELDDLIDSLDRLDDL